MKVFITYPKRTAYDAAMIMLSEVWNQHGAYPGTDVVQAYNLIVLFAPTKVIL